jgi:hypothetical protein
MDININHCQDIAPYIHTYLICLQGKGTLTPQKECTLSTGQSRISKTGWWREAKTVFAAVFSKSVVVAVTKCIASITML